MARVGINDALPIITELTLDLVDGKLTQEEIMNLLPDVLALVQKLLAAVETPGQPTQPPPTPPVVVTPPVAPQPPVVPGRKLRIVALRAKVSGIYGRDNMAGVGEAATQNVLSGGNMDNGWHLHTDCTPVLEDGTELRTGDPRWAQVHRWSPNNSAVWPVYEYDSQVTDIRKGDQGSPYVDPKSFTDDEHCTVTFQVETPEPHKTQHTFRFGYIAQNEDGSWVESGMIGQGNLSGGEPFNVR